MVSIILIQLYYLIDIQKVCDFRPVSKRQSNAAIVMEQRCTDLLGYTREDLISMLPAELLSIIKRDLPNRGSLYQQLAFLFLGQILYDT